jgi:hypothetical protein
MRDAWVDFNDVHQNRTTTLLKLVEGGVVVEVGRQLVVGDHDGNVCRATVVGIKGEIVELAIDPESFQIDADVSTTATRI